MVVCVDRHEYAKDSWFFRLKDYARGYDFPATEDILLDEMQNHGLVVDNLEINGAGRVVPKEVEEMLPNPNGRYTLLRVFQVKKSDTDRYLYRDNETGKVKKCKRFEPFKGGRNQYTNIARRSNGLIYMVKR